jgi:FkbM family methyltransferase
VFQFRRKERRGVPNTQNRRCRTIPTKQWHFDAQVASIFEDHIRKSVPFYDERRKMRWLEDPLVERRGEPEGSVKAFPFDELAKRESIEPDVVKVDVHGAEGNVIKGMKNSLRRSVSHIYCELHQEMTDGYSARDVIHALQHAGLETFEFRGFRTERGHLVSILDDPTLPPGGIMVYGRK